MKNVLLKSLLVTAVVACLAYFYAMLPEVKDLRTRNPKSTALMELRDQEYRQKGGKSLRQQVWVPYAAISEHLKKAVLISEDAAFFSHTGVDVNELQEALKKDWETGSFARGGSTITMQLAKNLYLNPVKSPLRKAKEIVIAWQLERALSKRRIFEIYLNVVEWGENLYGVEAAAGRYFAKSAANLDIHEAATLAAMLPNPRNPRVSNLARRRNLILSRMAAVGYLTAEEFNRAKQTLAPKKVATPPLLPSLK
ncbi:MAG: monofunctional biosynthetic peptidoglycan transglycosylase [Candidatus Binatia bacterium]